MTIQVIGAGMGRTGTLSLKLALERLGFGPCCHGVEERHFRIDGDFWQRAFDHEPIDWDEFFLGYRSTVDSPSCKFYLELASKYRSAKVVLTWRDPNAWYESYKETILPMTTSAQGKKHFAFVFGCHPDDRDSIVAAYERHYAEVQRTIPSERLLVLEIRNGWKPLCEFLEVPIPDTPFPRANLRENFPSLIDGMLARMDVHQGS